MNTKKSGVNVRHQQSSCLMVKLATLLTPLLISLAWGGEILAQSILPAIDGTDTIVNREGNRFNITGGRLSSDQRNLFHSFQVFNLTSGETANFISTPRIDNILTRVVGGASLIDGLLQVTGGNANLFLMNPAGIIFGRNARLDLSGSFIATTADAIGFESESFFESVGNNDYAALVGNPNTFVFDNFEPEAIINAGNLAVSTGQNIILLAGTVISTGELSAPGGQVIISAVPGDSIVRITQNGNLLSLEISQDALSRRQSQVPGEEPPDGEMPPPDGEMPPRPDDDRIPPFVSLAELLTGGNASNATNVILDRNGQFVLTDTDQTASVGDVIVRNITARTIQIEADNNLTTGNLRAMGGITLTSGNEMETGILDTSNPAGNAGNILLNSGNDITVNYLNATASEIGGDIIILSEGNFRALGGFLDQNDVFASISTAGGLEGGSIFIEVESDSPFIVGNPLINGTAAAITTGVEEDQIIAPTLSFRGRHIQGNDPEIEIIVNRSGTDGGSIDDPSEPDDLIDLDADEELDLDDIEENADEEMSRNIDDKDESDTDLVNSDEIDGSDESLDAGDDVGGDILGEDMGFDLEEPDGEVGDFDADSDYGESDYGDDDYGDDDYGDDDYGDSDFDRDLGLSDFGYSLDLDIDEAITEIETVKSDEFTRYLGASFSIQPATPANIRQTLTKIYQETGNHSALLYIVASPQQVELVLITSEGSPIRKTVMDVDRNELLKMVTDFRGELTNPRGRTRQTYKVMAQQLYQWLIAPIEPDLQAANIETVLFSMDSGLRGLPVAALYDGQQFFVEKYSFSFIPSISLTDTRYQSLADANVLAMGASEFTNNQSPLPAVPMELSLITETWPGNSFLNQEFTLNNLRSKRQEQAAQIVHLATHGEFKPGAPSNSYIQLWDSQLHLDQLRELQWYQSPAVELLVLSACRTAVGDESTELGFGGLAVQAGVKSALASLWYVSDEGTLALMTEFYNQLKDSTIKAEALQQAQLALLRGDIRLESGELRGISGIMATRGGVQLPPQLAGIEDTSLSHPYYWSGFMMIGSPW